MFNKVGSYQSMLNSTEFQVSNLTHIGNTYVENQFAGFMGLSLFQTFVIIFLSELGDKTFILMMVLKLKSTQEKTVFFSAVLAMFFTNFISIICGCGVDLLLYQNLIDILAISIFVLLGINMIFSSFELEHITYEEEVIDCLEDEFKVEKYSQEIRKNKSNYQKPIYFAKSGNKSKFALREPLLRQAKSCNQINLLDNELINYNGVIDEKLEGNYFEVGKEEKQPEIEIIDIKNRNFFWAFCKSIFIAEFGDRTQMAMIANSSIFNVAGVIIGSFLALLCIIYIAVYHGEYPSKKISEKNMCIINGFIFLAVGMEIFYSNNYLNVI